MSNNSNNIYNILGKLEALKPTAQEKHDATVKAIYESVEAQGSIIEGVDAIQAKLAQQFSESVAEVAPPGAKAERMVKGIKKSLSKDGHLSDKDKAIAYATTWKAHNKGQVEEAGKVCAECGMTEGECEHTMRESDDDQFSKILDACAAIYRVQYDGGDEIWDADWMQDWAHSLEQANPTDQELDFIIANGKMPKRLSTVEFNVGDDFQFSEAEITRNPGVTTHRKTEFPGYPADDIDDLDDLRGPGTGKRGRPRKHAAKAPTGLGRGRPVKAKAPTFSNQADPFSRVTGKVPAGKKGTVHTMAESMDTLARRLIEGINFSNMMKETEQTIDELMTELQNDIKEYKATGHCSDKLKDFMQVHAHSKKQMADEAIGGIGQDLVSPEQRVAQATPQKPGIMGAVKDVAQGAKNWIQGKPETGATYEEVTMEDELNELAKLAGLSEVSRGEYIKQQDTAAEKSGKDKFQAFGQEFDTDEITEEPNEGNAFTAGLADDDVEIGDKIPGTNAVKKVDIDESVEMSEESSDFNINTSMSSNGDKNVTVSATGDHAATLLQMLRIAGLGGSDKAQELQAEPEVEVISIDGDEGIEEESVDVDQPAQEPANAPDETYGTIKNITSQGDDMNREKSQDPATANKAANPMTNAQSVLKAVAKLESKLAEEYESIKKVSK